MISVIVSVYQQPVTLAWLLTCLAEQTLAEPFEIVVCDDGSAPEVLAAVEAAGKAGLDVRYVWQPNREPRQSRSRNNGIRCAQGDLLVFLDGDILVRPDFLERHRKAHVSPKLLVAGSRRYIDIAADRASSVTAKTLRDEGYRNGYFRDRSGQRAYAASRLPWLACFGFNLSVRRAAEVQFDERFVGWGMDDCEFACRLCTEAGYSAAWREDIEILHVQVASAPLHSPLRTNEHEHIVRYLRNSIHFLDRFPTLDLRLAFSQFLHLELDPSGKWRFDKSSRRFQNVDLAIERVRSWLESNPA